MSNSHRQPRGVSVIMTVKNDRRGCAQTLRSLIAQTRAPDEIVVADGGSSDGTQDEVRAHANGHTAVRLIDAPGANIATGRNIATREARHDIIASTDCGCRAEPTWLERLVAPFEEDEQSEFVAGFYSVDARSLLECVVGLVTMRGQLDPPDPKRFNPSGRSVAYTKSLWRRAGGWPEWVNYSEDTLFDHRVRALGARWRFVENALVHWRPRNSLRRIARQFYNYGTGRGHTQIDAASFRYNLRNAAIVLATFGASLLSVWFVPLLALAAAYFYVWTFHATAMRVARHTKRAGGYPTALIVLWTVLVFHTLGYVVGTVQRAWRPARYGHRLADDMVHAPS